MCAILIAACALAALTQAIFGCWPQAIEAATWVFALAFIGWVTGQWEGSDE